VNLLTVVLLLPLVGFLIAIWMLFEKFARGIKVMDEHGPLLVFAAVLIVAGVLGLLYGGFSYTKETHEAKLGPIELTVKDKETVNIPVWAGVGTIAIGGVLLLLGGRKS